MARSKTVPCACGCGRQIGKNENWDRYHGPSTESDNMYRLTRNPVHEIANDTIFLCKNVASLHHSDGDMETFNWWWERINFIAENFLPTAEECGY